MVIFHSYVKLPEGNHWKAKVVEVVWQFFPDLKMRQSYPVKK
jgi:hypothetical protein